MKRITTNGKCLLLTILVMASNSFAASKIKFGSIGEYDYEKTKKLDRVVFYPENHPERPATMLRLKGESYGSSAKVGFKCDNIWAPTIYVNDGWTSVAIAFPANKRGTEANQCEAIKNCVSEFKKYELLEIAYTPDTNAIIKEISLPDRCLKEIKKL